MLQGPPDAEAEIPSRAQILPTDNLNVNNNYCLGVTSAPHLVEGHNVNFACNQNSVTNVNSIPNNLMLYQRPPKRMNKSSLYKFENKRCKGCSYCLSVNLTSVVFHVLPNPTVVNLWSQLSHQEGSNPQSGQVENGSSKVDILTNSVL